MSKYKHYRRWEDHIELMESLKNIAQNPDFEVPEDSIELIETRTTELVNIWNERKVRPNTKDSEELVLFNMNFEYLHQTSRTVR